MLKASHLAKSYKSREVVRDVSISVEQGEIVGLLGPNGAGKTTCFYMIVGLVQANGGTVDISGKDITSLPIHKRAEYGLSYLPQDSSIFRTLTVENNILAILETRKDLSAPERSKKLESLLDEFNIQHIRHNKGMSLSGGERRRTEIARTLATDPKFILLDEPFAGVDPISVSDIKQIIQHLKSRNIGILLTDHNVRETLDICEKAYIVSEGHIIAEGDANAILSNDKVREVYLGEQFKI
ncbi:MAG: LPS export ABC transporter ATP-binding protein [Gammaproteobacteria bacterium]|jgi:lipopolysaccharide export system ATP-binding protein|nr:LPS export ABC transporter ATP-binding protein [Gammaproteobacteria bacterium]MBT3859916.1 LPS export ABC transporter ATP-binding protein [Gammaproteobacteria bacterium]MBT3986378.1 LPS export ABC transporter ATP-binding protein [Gammaproteobacteria bacterium]MBT4255029.1 LPS export ABC transporter ATP-binding protein [Gammaproteobacteria bacterium]MBT4582938.1 LPS export ABC transporter ATP-binding protein [Gammaproteobacteria bacterium]